MASQGFWSLGGDNAGANPGSQSPSTREWLFLVVQKKKKMSSEGLIPVHCLIPVLWIWPAVFYNRHICFYTFSLVCSCRNATDLCLVLFTTCMALQLTDLKVGCRSPSFFLFISSSSSQGLVPSGGPEILRRTRIEIMWYVAAHREMGMGVGWGGVGLGWDVPFPPRQHIIICRQSLKKCLTLAVFRSPKSAAQCRGSGETRRSGRQAAATERSCGHLRLQQILQLHQRTSGLLRPLFNRYKSKKIS